MEQKNFILTVENFDSPILITVPHGGIKNAQGAWLELFFKKRTKSETPEENFIKGEKVVLGGDNQIMHVVSDILKNYRANAVIGLLPRCFVDYNRFVPEVAYADAKIKPCYDAYHLAIERIIEELLARHPWVTLFDFHGFGKQPYDEKEFDIIVGTNDREACPNESDRILYDFLKGKYKIFCSGKDGMAEETLYRGDTTNLFYAKKYGIDGILVEIAPKFRSSKLSDSGKSGRSLAKDFSDFFKYLEHSDGKQSAGLDVFQKK